MASSQYYKYAYGRVSATHLILTCFPIGKKEKKHKPDRMCSWAAFQVGSSALILINIKNIDCFSNQVSPTEPVTFLQPFGEDLFYEKSIEIHKITHSNQNHNLACSVIK